MDLPYGVLVQYLTTSHTPGGDLQDGLLDSQEGAKSVNTERYVSRKLSAPCFQRGTIWHRHYSNWCGDVHHRKSAHGGCDVDPRILYFTIYCTSLYLVYRYAQG